jgi:hypothetical protein
VTAKTPASRAWPPRDKSGSKKPPQAHSNRNWPHVRFHLEHSASPFDWANYAGVERWIAYLTLDFDDRTTSHMPEVIVATATLVAIDMNNCQDLTLQMSEMSYDMSVIATAISESSDDPDDCASPVGMDTRILIAADVVVDKFWRGGSLGPSLLMRAADTLASEVVFLSPYALPTRVSGQGVCYSDYMLPRPGARAQTKVESAWRKAGFTPLRDDVLWLQPSHRTAEKARASIARIENVATAAHVRAWWRRRSQRRMADAA